MRFRLDSFYIPLLLGAFFSLAFVGGLLGSGRALAEVLPASTEAARGSASQAERSGNSEPVMPLRQEHQSQPPVQVDAVVDLVLEKRDVVDPVAYQAPLTYTLVVQNIGELPAENVILTDTLPVGTPFYSSTTTQGSCLLLQNGLVRRVVCELGTVLSGSVTTVTLVVTANTQGSVVNRAVVSSDRDDATNANNQDEEDTTILGPPTATPTATSTPVGSTTPTMTASATSTASATNTPTATGSATITPTPSTTASRTPTPTITPTPSPSRTWTASPTTRVLTWTPSPSASATNTPDGTPTETPTATAPPPDTLPEAGMEQPILTGGKRALKPASPPPKGDDGQGSLSGAKEQSLYAGALNLLLIPQHRVV